MLKLRDYQKTSVDFLKKNSVGLLLLEPGLGKTACSLLALSAGSATLVIAPKIAKLVWLQEQKLWRPEFFTAILKPGKKNFRYPNPGEVVVTTYDSLPVAHNFPTPPTVEQMKNLHIIFDEFHFVKSGKSLRANSSRSLCRIANWYKRPIYALTGTIIQNRPEELWAILDVLGVAKKAYKSKTNFVHVFGGDYVKLRFGNRTIHTIEWGRREMLPEAREGLKKVSVRFTKSQVLPELPPKITQTIAIPTDLSAKAALKEFIAALKDSGLSITDLVEIIDGNAFRRNFDIGILAKARMALAIAKIPAMIDWVEENETSTDDPLIIFSDFRGPIKVLGERPGWAIIDGDVSDKKRQEIVQQFQSGGLLGIGCTIKAAGVALTLTRSSRMLFVDWNWTPAANRQSIDRAHRLGMTKSLNIYSLIMDHPVEHMVNEVILRKLGLEYDIFGES
jgi:SNF2 family DNA or RNA helicase